jgi:catechol 2,3-dioxygenase-like lactoylglutathione lyase family enzyme
MLSEGNVFTTVAVKDINAGKAFYGGTLGLNQVDENPGGVMYQSGSGRIFVYESGTAGTGQATCAAWELDDIEAAVADLKEKGITFEHYDMPDITWEGDISVMGPLKAAWFKDPDGNILSVGNKM